MIKKRLQRIGVLFLVLCLCISMFSCKKREDDTPEVTDGTADSGTYTIEIVSEGGLAMEGIGVYIYTDETQEELVWFAKSDASGIVTFESEGDYSYVAVLNGVPEGYAVEAYYPITGENTQIVLATEMADADDLTGITFKLGDVMYDLTVTDTEGTTYKLSELLTDKDAVVLNFWYLECTPCRAEFPYLQEAYEKYSDKIEVLALNPVNKGKDAEIAEFKENLGLTFPVALCDPAWEDAMQITSYPTMVVIDRYGTITLIHKGSVTNAQTFEDIFGFFTADDYVQTNVENVEDILSEDNEELEEINNPTEIGGVQNFKMTVDPGKEAYVDIYKLAASVYLQVSDPDAYVIYKGTKYTPKNGVVGLTIQSEDVASAVTLGFGNTGTERKTFTVTMSQFKGSYGNPYTMTLGEFTTSVSAGNNQGVYFTYKATESGTLAVQCLTATAGVQYDFFLYNLNTYAMRTLQGDSSSDTDGSRMVKIKVNKGDTVQFCASTIPDSSGYYPACSFKFKAMMLTGEEDDTQQEVEKTVYSVTVTDESRNPISGVTVYVDVNGQNVNLTTNDKGVAATKQEAGTYTATLKLPADYTAKTTEFTLTEKYPSISVKLDKKIIETAVYQVKVVDTSGKPIEGALVAVGSSYGYTDANGLISMTLVKGSYTAYISADGYVSSSYSFADGATTLTAELAIGGSSADGVDYTVKIVDYSGNPVQNVTVTFLKDGANVGMKVADTSGTVTQKLEKGSYTVALTFSGDYYYDADQAVLTADTTSITIKAAEKCGTDAKELYIGGSSVGDAYYVTEGGTYLSDMQTNVVNYFLFTPDRAGVYEITTTDPAAVVSYWGSAMFPNKQDLDYTGNAFTINVKESMLGSTYVIGVTGAADAVLVITWISDPVLDESDIVAEVYEGAGTPVKYTVTNASGSLTYVDLTAAASAYKLVLDESTGYYHLNSVSGPILYVNLGPTAPYISFSEMLGVTSQYGTSFTKTFRDENGNAVRKEDYTQLMMDYCEARDTTYDVYPLTEDLMYMLQQGGDHIGWWDSTSPNYRFEELSSLNTEIAWMFACCYFG